MEAERVVLFFIGMGFLAGSVWTLVPVFRDWKLAFEASGQRRILIALALFGIGGIFFLVSRSGA